ncbi:MAG: aminomethyl-transferring glycine dehydrogenase subunit GcvPA [bacterium]
MGLISEQEATKRMMDFIGISSLEELFQEIPEQVRLEEELDLPGPMREWELLAHLRSMAGRNISSQDMVNFLGAGCYDHHVFSAVKSLIRRGEFFTAYTPYQPELSQGTLQAMFEFQTYVCRLSGMEVANASMYDGASALAEAVLMAQRLRPGRSRVVISGAVHPEYRAVVRTMTHPLGLQLLEVEPDSSWETCWEKLEDSVTPETSCLVIQNPNFFGTIEDLEGIQRAKRAIERVGGLLIFLVVETTSLGLLRPPGELGADIFVGEGQPLGLPMSFGGPHLGLLATKEIFLRQMPGRLVGQSTDNRGRRGFVLTLATREQHIRRERATSNICTNQSLCALAMTIQLALLGPEGLKEIAVRSSEAARCTMEALEGLGGMVIPQKRIYNEFVVRSAFDPLRLNMELLKRGIMGGVDLGRFSPAWKGNWLLCCTERTSPQDIDKLLGCLRDILA